MSDKFIVCIYENSSLEACESGNLNQGLVALYPFDKDPRKLKQKLRAAEEKILKLKQLMLLTDPVVSDVVMGDTQIKQHQEFLRCFPDERQALEKLEKLEAGE